MIEVAGALLAASARGMPSRGDVAGVNIERGRS